MAGLRLFPKVDVLAGSLQELYAVAHSNAPRKELITDPWGWRFISATSKLGRLLLFTYSHFDRFDERWRNKAITKVLERTHRLYFELYAQAQIHNQCIVDSIQAKIARRYVRESTLRKAKCFLTSWNAATVPFLEALQKGHPKFKEFLALGLIDEKGHAPATAPFGNCMQAKESACHQRVIDFEGHIRSPLPLALLYKASTGATLTKQENEGLSSFAKKIERNATTIKIHHLNQYLRALVKSFKKAQNTAAKPNLIRLATLLVKRQAGIFNQKDPQHLAWRKKFKPGDKLCCNGLEVILGQPIGRKAYATDNNLVFEVANASGLVAVFGINRLILPLKAQLAEEMGFGVRSAEYIQIAKGGKFALVEKLTTRISEHRWTSTKLPLDQRDYELILPIINCIRWFLNQNRTPAHFNKDVMYDAYGELKCAKYTVPLPFSLIDLEGYIWAIAAGNPHIFKYIMQNSGLLKHEHACYFHQVVKAVCEGRDPDQDITSQVKKIVDFHYVDRAKSLAQEVANIRDECVAIFKERYTCPENLAVYVSEAILEEYLDSGGASLLPPGAQEAVLKKVASNVLFRPKIPPI